MTRKPTAENVHRLDLSPFDRGDVTEVRGVGPVVSEDVPHRADLREPDRPRAEDVLYGEVEATVPGEQRPDAQRCRIGGCFGCF